MTRNEDKRERLKPQRMFALVNGGIVKHVAYYRRDCVQAGRDSFRDPGEYDMYIRKGWFEIVKVNVTKTR